MVATRRALLAIAAVCGLSAVQLLQALPPDGATLVLLPSALRPRHGQLLALAPWSRGRAPPQPRQVAAGREGLEAKLVPGSFLALKDDRRVSTEELAAHKHWLVIRGVVYDVGGYLQKHPGGREVLQRCLDGGDATAAFEATRHSRRAHRLLQEMRVGRLETAEEAEESAAARERGSSTLDKFFTREDRFQVHKLLGVYVLLHYAYRHACAFAGQRTAGFDGSWVSLLSVLPHALLSCSSFIFHVPRERVDERPMIWQEFRGHNVCFALRSVLAFCLLWAAEHARAAGAGPATLASVRALAVCGSAAAVLASMRAADEVTARLRADPRESTTATMPYWSGCTQRTQARFKAFYTYAQVLATLGCLGTVNPVWPFTIMLPIQLASLLMTCVRKGVLSTRGYHLIYAGSLVVPFLVGLRCDPAYFPGVTLCGVLLFWARRRLPRGAVAAKYALWAPVLAGRIALFAASGS